MSLLATSAEEEELFSSDVAKRSSVLRTSATDEDFNAGGELSDASEEAVANWSLGAVRSKQ